MRHNMAHWTKLPCRLFENGSAKNIAATSIYFAVESFFERLRRHCTYISEMPAPCVTLGVEPEATAVAIRSPSLGLPKFSFPSP